MVTGFEIDSARLLISVIYEGDFNASTTHPFYCMIVQLCRNVEVPIWHIDVLCTPTGTVDIGLIRDEDYEAGPWKGPKVEVQPLDENLEDMVDQAQGADHATLEPTDTAPVEFSSSSSRAPSSF